MKIAQVSPLFESVPPKLYGGTERVVFNLTEGLTALGHDVTLFASGDSLTSGRLIAPCRESLRLNGVREFMAPHLVMFEKVYAMRAEFDIIHFHNEYMQFPLARRLQAPTLSTMHGRLDLPEYQSVFGEFSELPMVSISHNQRQPLPYQNWVGTVHHGVNADMLRFSPRGGDYLAFLGRISPEKGVDRAIEIAIKTGWKIKIAAKVEACDRPYYESLSELFAHPCVEYIGEIGDRDKSEFLGNAAAVLFPIRWPEPFGLVMIESMATGTPVIAFRHGSVPEVVHDGVTGFIVESVDEACRAIGQLDRLKRSEVRAEFDTRFTVERMARDYVRIYQNVIQHYAQRSERPIRQMGLALPRRRALTEASLDQ